MFMQSSCSIMLNSITNLWNTEHVSELEILFFRSSPNRSIAMGFPGLSSSIFTRGTEACLAHDHELLSPRLAGTWAPHTVGGQPGRSLIFAETQVRHSTIKTISIYYPL